MAITTTRTPIIRCDHCQVRTKTSKTVKGELKLPPRWKKLHGKVLCGKCRNIAFAVRSLSLPVDRLATPEEVAYLESGSCNRIKPVQMPGKNDAERWRYFLRRMWEMWRESTGAMNFCMQRFAGWDETIPGKSLVKMSEWYTSDRAKQLYHELNEHYDLSSRAVIQIRQNAASRYKTDQFDVFRGVRSRAKFQNPTPYPLVAGAYTISETENREIAVRLPLNPREAVWVIIKGTLSDTLTSNKKYRFMADMIRRIVAGENEAGVLTVCADQATSQKGKSYTRVMLRLAYYKEMYPEPPKPKSERENMLFVSTRSTSFLVAGFPNARRNCWWSHEDHMRANTGEIWERRLQRYMKKHEMRMSRLRDDSKAERRSGRTLVLRDVMARRSRKRDNRIKAFMHDRSKSVADFAYRRGVTTVVYDDSERGYFESFPYSRFSQYLKDKLEERNIRMLTVDEYAREKAQIAENKKKEAMTKKEVAALAAGLAEIQAKFNDVRNRDMKGETNDE